MARTSNAMGSRLSEITGESIMRSILVLVLVIIATVMTPLSPKTNSEQAARQSREALAKLEEQWLKGERNPDVENKILADDFVHALPFGFITKADQVGFDRAHKAPPETSTRHFEGMRVRIYGTAGIVNGMVVVNAPDGKEIRRTVFTDVFAYRNGRWQAVNAQENPFQPRQRQ